MLSYWSVFLCTLRIFHDHFNTEVSCSFISMAVRDIGLKSLSICLGGATLGMGETFAGKKVSSKVEHNIPI